MIPIFSDSSTSSRLYEFGYAYDHDTNQQRNSKPSSMASNELMKDHRTAKLAVKTSPVNHYERSKTSRGGENNSLTRKHHEMSRKLSKDKHR